MNKAEIKREYKSLVRQGKDEKANKVLDQIRLKTVSKVIEKSKEVKKEKPLKKKEEIDSLKKIKGIGNKTIKDIKRICNSIDELKILIDEDRLPLRDDLVLSLKKFLGV